MSYPLFLYELRYVHSPVVPGLTGPTSLRRVRPNPFPRGQAKQSSPSGSGEDEPMPSGSGEAGLLSQGLSEAALASLGSGEVELDF
jgi:hypothetical protein